ncbi:hypothetical protein A7U60_g3929 [Sanghuangporus baumii]|uniref:DUF6533 domain-containing protein n=1 Tax=Sanghuangporus baumii TaxID=108892 RepID=A0A9Q5HZQ1_SANBA|nr:hypothetical protein A7U60_g3929 [Sanghuangporus baumii]
MDILDKGGTSDISSLASQAMTIRYSAVANLAIWLYEFSMTADKEVRLVWPSRFTIIKLLFFANRYLPLFTISANAYFLILNDNEDEYLCKPALLFIGYMSFAGFFLAEGKINYYTASIIVRLNLVGQLFWHCESTSSGKLEGRFLSSRDSFWPKLVSCSGIASLRHLASAKVDFYTRTRHVIRKDWNQLRDYLFLPDLNRKYVSCLERFG